MQLNHIQPDLFNAVPDALERRVLEDPHTHGATHSHGTDRTRAVVVERPD